MKLYVLPVDQKFKPDSQAFRYPEHNHDYGVEQDFYRYVAKEPNLLVADPAEADWHYLPVFWTRWHLNHDYAKTGLSELQEEIEKAVLDSKKTFTICQYDDGPVAELDATTVFLASRKGDEGRDIPLLCAPHKRPLFKPRKKYLGSFSGRLSTHPLREEMATVLQDHSDIFISNGDNGSKAFVDKMLESYVALCPRGYGGSSFRFFEAMQLGVVPFLVGDIDTRPFKGSIDWSEISLFATSPAELTSVLSSVNQKTLLAMGKKARDVWRTRLRYQKWCPYVLEELLC